MLFGDIVERHLLGLDQNFRPHFMRLDPGFARDRVEHEFEREADAGSRNAAIGQDRAFVGRDRIGAAAIGGKIVRTRQDACDLRRFKASRERIRRIGAGIDGGLAIDAAQFAIAIRVAGDAVMVLAAIGAGGQMLAPILDPAHRMSAPHSQPAQAHFFRQQYSLIAEAAADIRRNDADLPFVESEASGKPGAHDVRHLARGVERELRQAACPTSRPTPRPSIGAMHCRAVRISRVTLIGASNALSMFTSTKVSRKTLSPQSLVQQAPNPDPALPACRRRPAFHRDRARRRSRCPRPPRESAPRT